MAKGEHIFNSLKLGVRIFFFLNLFCKIFFRFSETVQNVIEKANIRSVFICQLQFVIGNGIFDIERVSQAWEGRDAGRDGDGKIRENSITRNVERC